MAVTTLASADLESTISTLSTNTVLAGGTALIVLVVLAILFANKKPKLKAPLFICIALVVISTTSIISGGTVYLNVKSATGGPVHWHADFEVWACGNELEVRNPIGAFSNKIGSPTLHEHNDKRIHLEGVPVTLPEDASLGKFMSTIGGSITDDTLVVPLTDGDLFEDGKGEEDGDGSAKNDPDAITPFVKTEADGQVARFVSGQTCSGEPAEVQAFVYTYNEADKTYSQRKLEHPAEYAISKHSDVPPADCVIFEFGPRTETTDKLCKQYGVRDMDRCSQFGVEANERKICEIKEVR